MLEPSEIKRWERQLRAMLRNGADQDPEGLAAVVDLITQAYKALPVMVELHRAEHGYSWADVAGPLGVTRQAAHERFGIKAAVVVARSGTGRDMLNEDESRETLVRMLDQAIDGSEHFA